MTKEQKKEFKRLLSNYSTMKLQIECIDEDRKITMDNVEGLK